MSSLRRLKTLTMARPLRCASSRSFGPSTGSNPSRVRVPWSRAFRMSMSLGLCLPNERVSTDNFGSHESVPYRSYFGKRLQYDFNDIGPRRPDRFSDRHGLRPRRGPLQRISHQTHFRDQAARRNEADSAPCRFYPDGGIGEPAAGGFLSAGRALLAGAFNGDSAGK